MPYCFPKSTTKALYLDSDILVLDDLAELWRTDLQGRPLAAAVDSHSAVNAQRIGLQLDSSDASPGGHYFNAGVLLVDLPKWRSEQISERALDYLTENPLSLMADQDALNIACRGMWKEGRLQMELSAASREGISSDISRKQAFCYSLCWPRKTMAA